MWLYVCLTIATFRRSGAPRRDLLWENLALRQQLAIYQRQTHRPRLRKGDRWFWTWLRRHWAGWREAVIFVQPETVIRWERARWRRHWARRSSTASWLTWGRSRTAGRDPAVGG